MEPMTPRRDELNYVVDIGNEVKLFNVEIELVIDVRNHFPKKIGENITFNAEDKIRNFASNLMANDKKRENASRPRITITFPDTLRGPSFFDRVNALLLSSEKEV